MEWLNFNGIIFVVLIMVPNIVYAIKCSQNFENLWHNKVAEVFEQIGRYGCIATMIINVPYTYFGYIADNMNILYLTINAVLILLYCLIWIFTFYKQNLFKALTLSILPSLIFLFSGIITRSCLLVFFALIFAPCHILISVKNCIHYNKIKE